MLEVSVRPALPSDLEALTGAMGQREYFVDRFARQARDDGVVLVARSNGRVVGDVYLWLSPADEPEVREHLPGVPLIHHLEVHPKWQNRGIGTALIARAEELARRQGHQRIALGVGVDNPRARKLYERLGFRDWGHGLVDTSFTVLVKNL